MKLISTVVTDATIRLRYADDADPAKATQWLDFQLPLAELHDPDSPKEPKPLGNPDREYLGGLRLAALRHAQAAITAEIRDLKETANRTA